MALLSVIWAWTVTEELVKTKFPLLGIRGWKNKEQPKAFVVADAIFDAIYKHAEPHLRDAMDLATATGMRVMDVVNLRITDQRGDLPVIQARKTGKLAEYDLTQSAILPALIERRKAHKALHFSMLTKPTGKQVTLRMLQGAFDRARTKAVEECPEAAGAVLRYMRKRPSRLAGSLDDASNLLQHSSRSTTQRHYPAGEKLRPVR
ncbi:MAG: integrase [Caldimonas sp.]